jgi:hypothetical protein
VLGWTAPSIRKPIDALVKRGVGKGARGGDQGSSSGRQASRAWEQR